MPILFYTEGESLVSGTSCNEEPRKWKEVTLAELKVHTKRFQDATQRQDVPIDLRNKLIVGCKFPISEVEMLIKQSKEATHLQIFYGMDNEKHFHYMIATTEANRVTGEEGTLIIEDCCRIPPNTDLDPIL